LIVGSIWYLAKFLHHRHPERPAFSPAGGGISRVVIESVIQTDPRPRLPNKRQAHQIVGTAFDCRIAWSAVTRSSPSMTAVAPITRSAGSFG
jgi:hypothetical protein